ncbi:hypothetical protein B0A49_13307, partial [Cryomyces minteri]
MWGSGLPEDSRLGRVESGPKRNQWHNPADHQRNQWHYPGDPNVGGLHAPHELDEDESSGTSSADDRDGTWGESDVGGLNQRMAMEDYEALRRNLTNLSRTRSQLSRTKSRQEAGSLYQTLSRISGRPTESRKPIRRTATRGEESEVGDVEAGPDDKDEFELDTFMREGHFEKRVDGRSAKKVGVVYKSLTVKGIGSTASFVRTLPDAVLGTFGPDLYRIVSGFVPALRKKNSQMRTLINDFTGVVRDGEMMLVLGRPGSGCSTFLKAVSNNREGYAEVTGDVSYGGIPAAKQKKMYRGEVNYNPEDDVHFATLN